MERDAAEPGHLEEQLRMVEESAEAVVRDDRIRARGLRFTQPGFDRAKWQEFVDLGWLALRVDEDQGGLGMGLTELCAIARHMGRQLTPEPIIGAASIAPYLPQAERDGLLAGALIILPAFAPFEHASTDAHEAVEPVLLGEGADVYMIADDHGAWLLERSQISGARVSDTHDGGHLLGLSASDLKSGRHVEQSMVRAREEATLGYSAYLLGVSEAAFELTVEYLKDRKQFDRPIGSFQALQHRMVDLYLELALLRASIDSAALQLDAGQTPAELARAVSLAKARASKAASTITQSAVQLHGGIGYTDEADIGLYLRKAMTLSGLLGSERFHRTRAFDIAGVMA